MVSSRMVVGLLAVFAAGCGSSGQSRTAGRIESIQELRESLTKGTKQIDTTLTALDGLMNSSTGDLRPAYKKFDSELAKLDSDAATVRSRADAMRTKTREYFDAWRAEVQAGFRNQELKRLSEDRQAAAQAKFDDLRSASQGAREAYDKFSADLHEVKKFFDLELNPGAINSAKPLVAKTKESSQGVKDGISQVVAKLEETVKAINPVQGTPGQPAPGAPPAGQPAGTPPAGQPTPASGAPANP